MSWIVRYSPSHVRRVRIPFERAYADMQAQLSPSRAQQAWAAHNLALDLYETGNEIVVKAALPGLSAEEVEIEEHEGVLSISAQSQGESEHQEGGWHIRERHSGAWQRSVQLPAAVKGDQAEAELRDGVLTIKLPKAAPANPINRIQVNLPKRALPKLGKREKKLKLKTD